MRSDLKTSPELMVVSRIGRKVHQLPSELLRKPALTSLDHITSGLQNHGTRVQLSSRILISPHCWWTLPSHPRSNSHDREAHSLNLTQQKNKITWITNCLFLLFSRNEEQCANFTSWIYTTDTWVYNIYNNVYYAYIHININKSQRAIYSSFLPSQ